MVNLITYTEKHLQTEDIELFRKIEYVIDKIELPHIGEETEVTCHMLADAVSDVFCLEVIRGHFIRGYEHSWLVTKHRNLIDVYPFGMIGGPMIIAREVVLGSNGPIYIPKQDMEYKYLPDEQYQGTVDIIIESMKEILSSEN